MQRMILDASRNNLTDQLRIMNIGETFACLILSASMLPLAAQTPATTQQGNTVEQAPAPQPETAPELPSSPPLNPQVDDSSDLLIPREHSNTTPVPDPAVPDKETTPNIAAASEAEKTASKQPFTSTSASKQFQVIGNDAILSGALASRADAIRSSLLKILKRPNEWKNNIIIRLVGTPGSPAPANPIRMQTTLLGTTVTYHIYVHLGRGVNQDKLRHAIISSLLYEMMLRKIDPEGLPEKVNIAPWIISGLEQAVLWNINEADRTLYASLFQQDGIMTPDEILKYEDPEQELDATTYATYQASCGALMLCLLNQKNGEDGMKELLDQAILGGDDPKNLIKRHFPQLNLTPTSLHKWWTLQLSRMAEPPLTETLSIPDTEHHLQEALTLVKYDPESRTSSTFPLDNIASAQTLPDLNRQLSNISNSLLHLSRRAFPAYRPVIVEYAKLVALLQSKRITAEQADPKIKQLQEIRELSGTTAKRVRDYMDWYEINTRSGSEKNFASYAATMKMLREKEEETNTPISQYLDDIEKLYTLPAKAPVPSMHQEN